ncbi:hypothetical protein [Owenweeksia hongkongensis]|uniref:TetR/AcrR family transcriptional regulator n=1 Tax=Owenweeksia hongkongensis TaxID=253245 RepID=UPI003A9465F6
MEAQVENPVSPALDLKKQILSGYREYILMNGHEPPSINAFCKELNMSEEDFYLRFNSFEQVAEAIWSDLFDQVIQIVKGNSDYAGRSIREKLMSFYGEFFCQMKSYRSYAMITLEDVLSTFGSTPSGMGEMKKEFKAWVKQLIEEGVRQGRVAERNKLTDTYDSLLWFQFLFLLNFWKRDKSVGFEKTEVAVEKSVILTFDLIEKNALDSALEFGKFIFQSIETK